MTRNGSEAAPLRAQLDALLDERAGAVEARERETFERLAGSARPRPLVLHGAGNLGRKTLAILGELDFEVAAFSDNSKALVGQRVCGLEVVAPADVRARFGAEAAVIVTVWGSGIAHRFEHTRAQFAQAGVSHVVPAAALFWRYPERFLPHYALDRPSRVIAAAAAVRHGFAALSDDGSRQEFLRQLRFRLWLDFEGLASPAPGPQYFVSELFAPRIDEVYLDCGAYSGDTLASFLEFSGGRFDFAYALEPDPGTRDELSDFVARLPPEQRERVAVSPFAAWDRATSLRFDGGRGLSSTASATGALEVEARPIDQLCAARPPTFIKMDIEGAEPPALEGARETIATTRPVLAICAYHVQDHLWTIPAVLRRLAPEHVIELRTHGTEAWDSVCYAFPPERSARHER